MQRAEVHGAQGQNMQKSEEARGWCSCACARWRSHLLSKRRALLEWTAEISGTGEQVGLLDSGERAARAAVVQPELRVAADYRHWELQVVHAWQ